MPKKAIDFSDTVFYKIVCKDLNIKEIYVGHDTNFRQRKSCHKSACNKEAGKAYDIRVYKFIREHGGWENFNIIVVHRQSCFDSLEAHTKERIYIKTLNATLNCTIPTRTKQEWTDINLEKIKDYKSL